MLGGTESSILISLQSQLFRSDAKLEAAAVSDGAHIVPGAAGPHVRKIQLALNLLDGAAIVPDSIYGPATAAAVLAYKQKRNIINRRYQMKADNIVGRMTIAALDAEMLGTETDNTRPPRIVAVYPTQKLSYRSSAVLRFQPVALRDSKRGAKTVAERAPRIVFPGQPFQAMELWPNRFGSFQVIDGVGGTVSCWDNSIGKVFDPAEPIAHGGTMRVTKSPQQFNVHAYNVGRTFIEARKAGQRPGPPGDLITLVVVAPSTKLMWRPQWTPTITNPITCVAYMSHAFGAPAVLGVGVFGPMFDATGIVDPDITVPLDDFELGILQAEFASDMTAVYVDAGGRPTWTLTIGQRTLPIRDADDETLVWVKKTAVKSLNAPDGKTVKIADRPRNVVPWQTKDKKGTLVSSSGADLFCTWLAARQKSTGTFTFLCWAMWAVDWGCTFDFKSEKGTSTGTGTIKGQGDDGQGPLTPITGGKIANNEITMTWTGPPGGF